MGAPWLPARVAESSPGLPPVPRSSASHGARRAGPKGALWELDAAGEDLDSEQERAEHAELADQADDVLGAALTVTVRPPTQP